MTKRYSIFIIVSLKCYCTLNVNLSEKVDVFIMSPRELNVYRASVYDLLPTAIGGFKEDNISNEEMYL